MSFSKKTKQSFSKLIAVAEALGKNEKETREFLHVGLDEALAETYAERKAAMHNDGVAFDKAFKTIEFLRARGFNSESINCTVATLNQVFDDAPAIHAAEKKRDADRRNAARGKKAEGA